MKSFKHIDALSIEMAVSNLNRQKERAYVIAGGTDLIGVLKDEILPTYPEILVNLKTIPGLDYIKKEQNILKIGALTRLEVIATNELIRKTCTALSQAASMTASPNIRQMGTIAGNICQHIRCWYYRAPKNFWNCLRKNPTGVCQALLGDNRYHSIFGALNGCVAVNPSDTAPALVALDAKIVTTKQTVSAEDFFSMNGEKTTILDDDELVTEIQVPEFSGKSAFLKFAIRKSIDFPIVNCATAISNGSARICLNAVYNNPYRATAAEDVIAGQTINEANAEAAGTAAVANASDLPMNKYKVQIAKTLVKRTILACE